MRAVVVLAAKSHKKLQWAEKEITACVPLNRHMDGGSERNKLKIDF